MQKPDLSLFPHLPGCYFYKDASGRILYVGKAADLRKRLASYFRDDAALSPKTRSMLRQAESIDTLTTGTEKEALLLEAGLIKKHRPRYNILLRDDKDYLLFRINARHPYPRLEVIRKPKKKSREPGALFFGPYSSGFAARETWKIIHKAFPLRRCSDRSFINRTRPCLYHYMGQCLAPCVLPVAQEEYKELLDKVILLLSGRSSELLNELRESMLKASDSLDFERAALLRDQLRAVEKTVERQSVVLHTKSDLDLVGLAQTPKGLALGLVFVRQGLLVDGRNFFWPGLTVEDGPELLSSFLTQFYREHNSAMPGRIVLPWLPEISGESGAPKAGPLIDGEYPIGPRQHDAPVKTAAPRLADSANQARSTRQIDRSAPAGSNNAPNAAAPPQPLDEASASAQLSDAIRFSKQADSNSGSVHLPGPDVSGASNETTPLSVIEALLSDFRGAPVRLSPPRGQDEDQLVLMAAANAKEAAKNKGTNSLAEALAAKLHVKEPVRRIEAVDISHTGGQNTRAGMVVFEDEQPLKSDYRTYGIEAGEGDDYAALAAWAGRRAKTGPPWPDLVLVDGGKGQLSAVKRAFEEAGVNGQFVIASIAKARTEEGRADRRAGNVSDNIFLADRANPLPLAPGSPELLFLQRVRDTVHDFVLGRHRQARSKAALSGELTRLPGIGPKLARLLYEKFNSLAEMAKATTEEISNVPGVGKKRAALLKERLKKIVEQQ